VIHEGTTVTNQILIHEEIKSRLSSSKLLSSGLLPNKVKIKRQNTTILRVIFYGFETWSLILREENRLKVFQSRVLRRIFGLKGDEVAGSWRKPHNELHNLYSFAKYI
jgi:hypothetical protein